MDEFLKLYIHLHKCLYAKKQLVSFLVGPVVTIAHRAGGNGWQKQFGLGWNSISNFGLDFPTVWTDYEATLPSSCKDRHNTYYLRTVYSKLSTYTFVSILYIV